MGVEITGLDQVFKNLKDIQENIRVAVSKNALYEAGAKVRDTAADLAPGGDSGQLKGTMDNTVEFEGGEAVGYVFSPKEYATYVEYGTGEFNTKGDGRKTPWVYNDGKGFHWTRGQHPQPFLYPALAENKANIEKIIAAEIKKFVGD